MFSTSTDIKMDSTMKIIPAARKGNRSFVDGRKWSGLQITCSVPHLS